MADTAVVGALARIEPQLATEAIANERFIRQLDELRALKEFLFEEKVQFKEEDLDSIDLEELNNLSYSASGRIPSAGEWRTLDEKLTKLVSYLSDDLRRKIRIRELRLFFRTLPIIFLVFSVFSSMTYLIIRYFPIRPHRGAYCYGLLLCLFGRPSRRAGRLRVFRNISHYEEFGHE
jgi:hypothetical protein